MSVVSRKILQEYDPDKPFYWSLPLGINRKAVLEPDPEETTSSRLQFEHCKIITTKEYNFVLNSRVNEDKLLKMKALPAFISSPVVHSEIVSILQDLCPGDFQALPILIKKNPDEKDIDNFENRDYYILNILNNADTMDYNNSEFKYFNIPESSSKILGIRKLVFKKNCLESHHFVREKNYKSLVVVSREVALLLNAKNVKGVELIPDYAAFGY